MSNVTFSRVANGEFQVLNNGVATQYTITNGSMGVSGNGRNEYLIAVNGDIKKSGLTLQKAKKMVAFWISKETPVADTAGWEPVADQDAWMAADAALIAAHKAKQGK